ncbi:MAG: hypothetical protein ACE14O_06540 [Candidatus Cloacimonadaceae bacterium]
MQMIHDRFVNNDLLNFISRPQYEYSCSISALTAVFNYLFSEQIGIKTSNELAIIAAKKQAKDITGAGNLTIMKWFDILCKHYKLKGISKYYLRKENVTDWSKNSKVITDLKEVIRSKDKAFIYHMENHYNVIVGYFEHSDNPDEAYNTNAKLQRWIVLGEHSDYNPLNFPKIKNAIKVALQKIDKEDLYNYTIESAMRTPIWTRKWRSIRHDLINSPNHCIMVFSKEEN